MSNRGTDREDFYVYYQINTYILYSNKLIYLKVLEEIRRHLTLNKIT